MALTERRTSPEAGDHYSNFLIPVMRMPAEIDRRVFFAHAKTLIVLESLKRSAVVSYVIEAPLNDNEILVDLRRRTPVPIVLVSGIGAWQSILRAKLVNRARFAVVAGPNAGLGSVLGSQGVIDGSDLTRHLRPPELVGNRWGAQRLLMHLGVGGLEADSVLIGEETLGRQKPSHQRDSGKRSEHDDRDYGHACHRAFHGGAICQPSIDGTIDHDGAAGQEHRIDREHVVVLGVRNFHQYEEDGKGQAEHAPAEVAEKPEQAQEPDRE